MKFKEITLMNAFLCFCVVMIHLTSVPVTELAFGQLPHTVIFIVNRILCFSVPAFIFLSGFKLYNKFDGNKINLKKFFAGRFEKIFLPYLACVFVYFFYFLSKQWVSLKDLPQYIFLGTLAAHFYYIVIALQLYLLFPFLKGLFEKFPKVTSLLAFIITVAFQQFFPFTYSDRFFGSYIFYFIVGMAFSKLKLNEKFSKLHLAGLIGFISFAILHLRLLYLSAAGEFLYRYANLVNVIYVTFAICALHGIFVFLKDRCSPLYRLSKAFEVTSFNIYLYHLLALSILQYDIFPTTSLTAGGRFLVSSAVIFGLMFVYTFFKTKKKEGGYN